MRPTEHATPTDVPPPPTEHATPTDAPPPSWCGGAWRAAKYLGLSGQISGWSFPASGFKHKTTHASINEQQELGKPSWPSRKCSQLIVCDIEKIIEAVMDSVEATRETHTTNRNDSGWEWACTTQHWLPTSKARCACEGIERNLLSTWVAGDNSCMKMNLKCFVVAACVAPCCKLKVWPNEQAVHDLMYLVALFFHFIYIFVTSIWKVFKMAWNFHGVSGGGQSVTTSPRVAPCGGKARSKWNLDC